MQGPSRVFLQLFNLKCRGWNYDDKKECNRCMLLRRSCPKNIRDHKKKNQKPPKKIRKRQVQKRVGCDAALLLQQLQLETTAATGEDSCKWRLSSFATAATGCNFFCFDWLTEALIKVMCGKVSSRLAVRDASRKLSVKKNSESGVSRVLTNH